MDASPENYFVIFIALLYLVGGLYLILTGILTLAKRKMKIPGFYQLGVLISNILYGSAKVARFEEDILDRKKAIRYSILWILIGLVSTAGGIFLLFVE